MKAAGKVMVVVVMVLALGMVAASDLSAASKNQAPSTSGAVWGGNGFGGGPLSQPVNHGQQHQQATKEQGCFAGTASENARCIAHEFGKKLASLVEGAIWGGGFTPPPPR